MLRLLCIPLCLFACLSISVAEEATKKIQEVSVTIKAGTSEGSGVIVVRSLPIDGKAEPVCFVLTAAHVVANLRRVNEAITENGIQRKVVTFEPAAIVKEFSENGRRVGETKLDCKVIKYSDADQGHDVAVLQVFKRGVLQSGADFYLKDEIPDVGTQLFHCGSLLGQMGANSMTTGIVSQIGRMVQNQVYDQSTVTAFPGSSGGGVWIVRDGKIAYVGMVTRGAGETFNLLVPIRRIRSWAKTAKSEWLLDPQQPAPALEDLDRQPIELVPGTSARPVPLPNEPTPAEPPKARTWQPLIVP
jgi:S1-C subfamily serine protease